MNILLNSGINKTEEDVSSDISEWSADRSERQLKKARQNDNRSLNVTNLMLKQQTTYIYARVFDLINWLFREVTSAFVLLPQL